MPKHSKRTVWNLNSDQRGTNEKLLKNFCFRTIMSTLLTQQVKFKNIHLNDHQGWFIKQYYVGFLP